MDGHSYRMLPTPRLPGSLMPTFGLGACGQFLYSNPLFHHGPAAPDSAPPFSGSSLLYTLAPMPNNYEATHAPFAPHPEFHPEPCAAEKNNMELLTTLCTNLKLSAAHSSTLQAYLQVCHTCCVVLLITSHAISGLYASQLQISRLPASLHRLFVYTCHKASCRIHDVDTGQEGNMAPECIPGHDAEGGPSAHHCCNAVHGERHVLRSWLPVFCRVNVFRGHGKYVELEFILDLSEFIRGSIQCPAQV